jgi:hypothetical protein
LHCGLVMAKFLFLFIFALSTFTTGRVMAQVDQDWSEEVGLSPLTRRIITKYSDRPLSVAEQRFVKRHGLVVTGRVWAIAKTQSFNAHSLCGTNSHSIEQEESDSIRHFLISYSLYRALGPAASREFMNAHEDRGRPMDAANKMDFYNNEVAFRLAKNHLKNQIRLTQSELHESALQLLTAKKLRVNRVGTSLCATLKKDSPHDDEIAAFVRIYRNQRLQIIKRSLDPLCRRTGVCDQKQTMPGPLDT